MIGHLHALETLGKHINNVTENNRDQRERLKQALFALKTARASILDVFKHGFEQQQRMNITRTDLPLIEDAIKRLELPGIASPKMSVECVQVPPSKFHEARRGILRTEPIVDAAIEDMKQHVGMPDGPVACGGLLKGEDLDEDLDEDPDDELYPSSQI